MHQSPSKKDDLLDRQKNDQMMKPIHPSNVTSPAHINLMADQQMLHPN